jgi:hypothetical protein
MSELTKEAIAAALADFLKERGAVEEAERAGENLASVVWTLIESSAFHQERSIFKGVDQLGNEVWLRQTRRLIRVTAWEEA